MKYYNYLQKAMEIKDNYAKVKGELSEEAAAIEKQFSEGRLAKVTYEEREEANKTASQHIRNEHIKSIDEVISEFKEFTEYARTPNGECLTSDYSLFNGLLTLAEDDLRKIADKNKYNLTMTNAVITYAKKSGITLTESMINNFANLVNDYDRMLKAIKDYIADEAGSEYMSRYVEAGHLEDALKQDAAYYADLDNYAKAIGIVIE